MVEDDHQTAMEEVEAVAVAEVDPVEVEEVDNINIREVHPQLLKNKEAMVATTIQIDHKVQCHQEHTIDNI